MGEHGLPAGPGGDAAGEGGPAKGPEPLGAGVPPGSHGSLAIAHHRRGLHYIAAVWHQCCEWRGDSEDNL